MGALAITQHSVLLLAFNVSTENVVLLYLIKELVKAHHSVSLVLNASTDIVVLLHKTGKLARVHYSVSLLAFSAYTEYVDLLYQMGVNAAFLLNVVLLARFAFMENVVLQLKTVGRARTHHSVLLAFNVSMENVDLLYLMGELAAVLLSVTHLAPLASTENVVLKFQTEGLA